MGESDEGGRPGADGGGDLVSVDLHQLVGSLSYKPGWTFRLHCEPSGNLAYYSDSRYDTTTYNTGVSVCASYFHVLAVTARVPDSSTGEMGLITHHFATPPPAVWDGMGEAGQRRWLLDQVLLVERHEACEFFTLDGERPFYPAHGDGNPYEVRDRSVPLAQARVSL